MSLSDFLTPEDRALVPWAGCLRCRFREHCTHFQNSIRQEALLRAARQGRGAAQCLRVEAERLEQSIAQAENIRALLDTGHALEETLAQILRAETAWLNELPE